MRAWLVLTLLAAGCSAPAPARIAWRGDLDAARAEALRTERPLVVFLGARWDVCSVALRGSLADSRVAAATEGYVAARVYSEGPRSERLDDALRSLGQNGVPRVLILRDDEVSTMIASCAEPEDLVQALET